MPPKQTLVGDLSTDIWGLLGNIFATVWYSFDISPGTSDAGKGGSWIVEKG
jgi:hypothetical protein